MRRNAAFEFTEAGRLSLAAAQDMERIAGRLDRTLEAQPVGLSGQVRLATTETLGTYFFLPRLIDFHRRNPGIVLELNVDHRTLSLSRRRADLAIRLARPKEEGLVAVRLGTMGYALYIHRNHPYCENSSGMLAPPSLCRFDESLAELPESNWLDDQFPGAPCVFRANSLTALYQAVRSGWGAGLLPCFLAERDEDLRVLSAKPVVSREIWLAYPEEFRNVPRYREVIDWLVRIAGEGAGELAG